MKNLKLLLAIVICSIVGFNANAQIGDEGNKFSVDINYPFLVGDNANSDFNDGAVDFGLKYNFIHITKLDLGLATDVGVITGDNIDSGYYIKPRVNAEVKVWKINPYAGLGYTFINTSSDNAEDFNESGVNVAVGLKWHILIPKLYLNFAYDFTTLNLDGDNLSSYEKNFEIFKVGVGIQL